MTKNTKVVGVWDDHDYGKNDGGKDWKAKDLVRDIFLDFVGEPNDTERRLQKGTSIHQDYYIEHSKLGITAHLILLDNRYSYDKKTNDKLGPEQWDWLDKVLKRGKKK